MKKLTKLSAFALSLIMAASLSACGGNNNQPTENATGNTVAEGTNNEETTPVAEGTTYKIGVLQLTQHEALDQSNKGFFAALDEAGVSYQVDQQNASGDPAACTTIANKLVSDGNDLILAIATPAAQSVAAVTSDIPVVITAVTDPAESGLVKDNAAPGGNITGTSDLTPVKEQIDLLKKLVPDAKKVGILYCSAESNSEIQANMAKEACSALGLEAIDFTVASSNEIQTVVESMAGKVDAIYAPTDNVIASGMATVAMIANDNNLPTICGEGGMVSKGGLATYGIDYYQLGYLAGKQAVDILVNGKSPSEIPIGYLKAEECSLSVNEETAKALNIDVSVVK